MIESGQKYKKEVENHFMLRKKYDDTMAEMWKVYFHITLQNIFGRRMMF